MLMAIVPGLDVVLVILHATNPAHTPSVSPNANPVSLSLQSATSKPGLTMSALERVHTPLAHPTPTQSMSIEASLTEIRK